MAKPATKIKKAAAKASTGHSGTGPANKQTKPAAKAVTSRKSAKGTANTGKARAKEAVAPEPKSSIYGTAKLGSAKLGKVGSIGSGLTTGSLVGTGRPASAGTGSKVGGKVGSAGSDAKAAASLKKTKLTARELDHFRDLLLEKRRQLVGDIETVETQALRTEGSNLSTLPVHMADMGTDNYEQEFALNLMDRDRQTLTEIDRALKKIEDKTYGICEGTGQMISKPRLEAQPWARYSIEYARQMGPKTRR